MNPELLFVYGSLMEGFELHDLLRSRAEFVSHATMQGRLISLGDYPGLLRDGGERVRGEVYRPAVPDALWPMLDEAEGYNAGNVAESLFVRETADVVLADGSTVIAWMYRYNGSIDGAVPIPSGNYRELRMNTNGRKESLR